MLNGLTLQSQTVVVARKEVREKKGESEQDRLVRFINEKRCLRLINHPPHPNIAPLLTSYAQNGHYYFLFPVFDMDLKAFFSLREPHGQFRWRFTYFSALRGLASALARLHEVHFCADGAFFDGIGYHHDLRPANVLVSRETFFLADFGMGGVREGEENSATRFKALAGAYIAPECMDDEFSHRVIGRAADVWAFGCLLTEVMTYAYLGVDGLDRFRAVRKLLRPGGEARDPFFHTVEGDVKAAVREWLNSLGAVEHQPALGAPLRALILSIFTPTDLRPTISRVGLALAHLSLKAHYFAVLEAMADVVDGPGSTQNGGPSMKLWFERERLRAFGNVLGFLSTNADDDATEFTGLHGDKCTKTLLDLFHRFAQVVRSQPPDSDETRGSGIITHQPVADEAGDEQNLLEADATRLVQSLWDLLPEAGSRKAERIWMYSMLSTTEDVEQLGAMEKVLGSQWPIAAQQGAALAMMKMIRLEMLRDSRAKDIGGLEIKDEEKIPVLDNEPTCGHQMGKLGGGHRVLVESIFYEPTWERIPPEERAVIMEYKARAFNAEPRPPSLLPLPPCLGFYETGKGGGRQGFSFVYRVSEPAKPPDSAMAEGGITTLNRLLVISVKQSRTDQHTSQPLLGDKFRLASALAGFLAGFHGIGWLHENLHSNNIVYSALPAGVDEAGISSDSSSILPEFLVVGLNRSRPGSEAWHTQGPAEDADFTDYRHPAYQHSGRFRVGYDYYSLGIVLLEIGLWTPLAAIARRREYRTLTPEELRNTLLSSYVPRLGYRMGKLYQEAVRILLSDVLDENPSREEVDPKGEQQAFSAFLEHVVDPLERLAGGSI